MDVNDDRKWRSWEGKRGSGSREVRPARLSGADDLESKCWRTRWQDVWTHFTFDVRDNKKKTFQKLPYEDIRNRLNQRSKIWLKLNNIIVKRLWIKVNQMLLSKLALILPLHWSQRTETSHRNKVNPISMFIFNLQNKEMRVSSCITLCFKVCNWPSAVSPTTPLSLLMKLSKVWKVTTVVS